MSVSADCRSSPQTLRSIATGSVVSDGSFQSEGLESAIVYESFSESVLLSQSNFHVGSDDRAVMRANLSNMPSSDWDGSITGSALNEDSVSTASGSIAGLPELLPDLIQSALSPTRPFG
jgi:hypothetical protein